MPFCYLRHILGNAGLTPRMANATAWHINADEPRALDYNDYNQPGLYSADAYRPLGHSPVVIKLHWGNEVYIFKYLIIDAFN